MVPSLYPGVPHVNEIVNPVHRLGPEQTTKFLIGPGAGMERYGDGEEHERTLAGAGLPYTSAIVHEAGDEEQWAGTSGLVRLESPGVGSKPGPGQVQPRVRRFPSSSSRSTSTAQSKRSRHAKSPCRKLATARALGMGAAAASTTRWTPPGGRSHHHRVRGTDRVCSSQ